MAASENALSLQETSYVLRTYSLGVTRIPLNEMACADFNRHGQGVNGKHAQSVVRRIFQEEGLQTWRYQRGLCIEPPPEDPLRFARFTNGYVKKQRELLAEVEERPLPGSFAKTHLWHSLHTAKVGGRCYWDTGLPLQANLEDPEVRQTFQSGMWYETLRYAAWQDRGPNIFRFWDGSNMAIPSHLNEFRLKDLR